jgi:hypothetical protein
MALDLYDIKQIYEDPTATKAELKECVFDLVAEVNRLNQKLNTVEGEYNNGSD